jgi:biotin carboxylase
MQSEDERKRFLVVGASILQLPAILRAKAMGFYVGVADYNPNAIGIPYADEYFNVSTIDVEGITKAAQLFHPDGMMTLATDMPMRAIAAASEACKIPGISYETAIKATDKAEMMKAFEEHGVEHPWYYVARGKDEFDTIKQMVTFPCIIKPTDNAGSRGVVLAHDKKELEKAYEYSHSEAREGTVIVEEYLQGPEFSIEVMVVDGEPNILQITDKLTTGAPHFVEMGHSQPSRQSEENQEKICNLAIRACKAVGIQIGPAHVELVLTKEGPKMVELGARLGGDCITTHLVPLSTGIDMVSASIDVACGRKPDIMSKFNKGSAIRYFHTSAGVLRAVDGIEEAKQIPGVQEIMIVKDMGTEIMDIGNSVDRIGFVIAQADTAEEAVRVCEEAKSQIEFCIESKFSGGTVQ